ncbi:MAG: hypothetical protein AB8H79_08685 [Myxococcota bacterium]
MSTSQTASLNRCELSPAVADLLAPVVQLLERGLSALPEGPVVRIESGLVEGFSEWRDGVLVLSDALMGPQMNHPDEPATGLALDRWRRALAVVLEGVATRALEAQIERPADRRDWRWVGWAAECVDAALPELQLGLGDLLRAARLASPGVDPRQGLAVFRAVRVEGEDPTALARRWLTEDGPSQARWLELGRWVLGAGLAAQVGVPVDLATPVDVPVTLQPWSWMPIEVPAHPRGGWVRSEGSAVIEQSWARGSQILRTLAACTGGVGALSPVSVGPIGSWRQVSARGWGQMFGIRGMTWTFHGDGRLEMVLADSAAGPVEASAMADGTGTSGIAPGRWAIAGERRLTLSGLDTSRLTLHGKGSEPFVLPAGGLSQVLQAMQGGVWRWRHEGVELYLTGPLMGGEVELRFRPQGVA